MYIKYFYYYVNCRVTTTVAQRILRINFTWGIIYALFATKVYVYDIRKVLFVALMQLNLKSCYFIGFFYK